MKAKKHDLIWAVLVGAALSICAGCKSDDDDDDSDTDGEGGSEGGSSGGAGGGGGAGGAGQMALDIGVCASDAGPFTLGIDNRYLPLVVGTQLILEGEEDGATLRVEFTVLDETEVVDGVTTRVVEERETEDGELVEISRNFFAQAPNGSVCYFGEDVDDYEDGVVVGHDGAWRAGVDGARAGILMPPDPALGMTYPEEVAPGIAEDTGRIDAIGEVVEVPAGRFEDTLRVIETSPLDAGSSLKVYAPGVGMIVDEPVRLIERR